MITNSFLPWRSDHLSLTEGSIVHAPTKRCDPFKYSYSKDFTFFSDVMNVNSWKHLLVTSRPKRLFIGRDHFQSEWFYRLASLSLPASPIKNFAVIKFPPRKLLGTHFEAGDSVPPWRRY